MSFIPVRCRSCNKVTGNKWEPWLELMRAGVDKTTALTKLGLSRPCCRSTILSHIDLYTRKERLAALETENMKVCILGTVGEEGDDDHSAGDD
jgi:DNA-directed RNA polymerases I, II, and III subunit RPABC5